MGYCEDHDKVYTGAECPVCAGEESTEASLSDSPDPASGETRRNASDERGDADAKSIDEAVEREVEDALDGLIDADADSGDVVVGEQTKETTSSETTTIDNSTVERTEIEETNDDRTVVDDSVVKGSDIGGTGETAVEDSVVSDSDVGGAGESTAEDSVTDGSSAAPNREDTASPDRERSSDSEHPTATECPNCGQEIDTDDAFCMQCGEKL